MQKFKVVFQEPKAISEFIVYLKGNHIPYFLTPNELEIECTMVQEDIRQAVLLLGKVIPLEINC